ncbi:MAG: hypothetical protein CVU63_01415 [Deltaproteobacteria bacterium HGW-Deltaproteobacteria-20]|nr:MAG: hypothetical protein CVU63_01415 [Deltaproteobacteria bacterium HGW-Deltaproteobacteria-20]
MSAEPRFNGVMLVNRLDNLGMLRGQPVLEQTLRTATREVRYAYRDRRVVSQRWLPMPWLVDLHEAVEQVTHAGTALSRQLGYFGTRRAFGAVGGTLAGLASPEGLFRAASKLFRTYYRHGALTILRSESQMVVARWDDCQGFDAHNWQVTFGSCEALLELTRVSSPHVQVVSGGGDGDAHAEITALWR